MDLWTTKLPPEGHQREAEGCAEKMDATFAEITVQPMRQSELATIQ
jgi:hypothetical protein